MAAELAPEAKTRQSRPHRGMAHRPECSEAARQVPVMMARVMEAYSTCRTFA
jgi:hypothetical protein